MPRGHLPEPRDVECRACGVTFSTDKVGRAAIFCNTDECTRPKPRTPRPRPKPQPTSSLASGPLAEDLTVVLRLAEEIGANPRVLKEAVLQIARGEGDRRFAYRRLAAVALASAAHVGGHRV